MKRILISFALLFFVVQQSQSQVLLSLIFGEKLNSDGVEFGLEGGFNWSSLSGFETNEYRRTFNLGFYFDIRLKEPWYLYTGTLVKSSLGVANLTSNDLNVLGINEAPQEGQYDQQINYFLVPIFMKYKFPSRFYLEAGPQLGLRTKAFVEFRSDTDDPEIVARDYNNGDMRSLEAGVAAGFGYKFRPGPRGMSVGVKYYHGLTRVYDDFKSYNRGFFLKLNVPIGAGKAEDFDSKSQKGN